MVMTISIFFSSTVWMAASPTAELPDGPFITIRALTATSGEIGIGGSTTKLPAQKRLKSRAMNVRLSKTFHFEAAHDLPTFPDGHKCRRLHGHSFRVKVVVEGEVEEKKGYL